MKLSGPDNFPDRIKSFRDIADINGYTEYYKEDFQLFAKPTAPTFLASQTSADASQVTVLKNWRFHLAIYNTQLQAWRD